MQVAKWGNSLAIRIPVDTARAMGIKVGDELDVTALDGRSLSLTRRLTREEAIAQLRSFRGRLPDDWKFDRDEANAR